MLLYTVLFFSLGAITTWLCFCWKVDKRESKYREEYLNMMDSRDGLAERNYAIKQENELLIKIIGIAIYDKENAAEIMLELSKNSEIAQKIDTILKRAKEKCQE